MTYRQNIVHLKVSQSSRSIENCYFYNKSIKLLKLSHCLYKAKFKQEIIAPLTR